MQKLLLFFFLLFSQLLFAQRGALYVKKKGYKTVKRFEEGDAIRFQTKNGQMINGELTLVNKDSVYVNEKWFSTSSIKEIYLRERISLSLTPTFLLTTAGVALSTAGMTLAKWVSFKKALIYSAGLGYGNYLIHFFPKLSRRKFILGKKFTLQTLDLHF